MTVAFGASGVRVGKVLEPELSDKIAIFIFSTVSFIYLQEYRNRMLISDS